MKVETVMNCNLHFSIAEELFHVYKCRKGIITQLNNAGFSRNSEHRIFCFINYFD